MEYFKKINLQCESKIRNFVIADVCSQLDPEKLISQTRIKHDLPDNLRESVNDELEYIGFPKLLYCQSYIRSRGHIQGIHIDGDGSTQINAAINLPISGTHESKHNWYTGDYTLILKNIGDLYFHHILWKSKPELVSSLELDHPHLVRVNEPHNAVSSDNDCRWIFTMRFVGNPSFEDLYDKLSSN